LIPDVLGLPLERAEALLKEAGYAVTAVEVRSRKGIEGGEKRVVRQREYPGAVGERRVEVTWAAFQTDVTA